MSDLKVSNLRGRTSGTLPKLPEGAVFSGITTIDSSGVNVTGFCTASRFVGDGSGLFNVATNSVEGITVTNNGNLVGIAQTIDFGPNLDLTPASAGFVTVTRSGIMTAESAVIAKTVGSATTINSDGIHVTGIVTAINFVGLGTGLVGVTSISNGTSKIEVEENSKISVKVGGVNIHNSTGVGFSMVAGKRFDVSSYSENVLNLGSVSGNTNLDIGTHSVFIADISGSTQVNFQYQPNSMVNGRLFSGTLILRFSGTGTRDVLLTSLNPKYIGGNGPTYSTTAVTDIISFFTPDNGATTYISVVGQGFA